MQFGVSTQLYHAQRLRRDHLAEVAAHGFDAVEIIATRIARRLSRRRASSTTVAGWLTREGLRLHCRARAGHGAVRRGAGSIPLSHRLRRRAAARAQAVRETGAALELARAGARVACSWSTWACRTRSCPPPSENSRDAARRSLEEIADARVAARRPRGARGDPERDVDRRTRWCTCSRTSWTCPRSASASTSATRTCMGDVVDAIETLSGRARRHARARQPRPARRAPGAVRRARSTGRRALMALQKIGYDGTLMLELAGADPSAPALDAGAPGAARASKDAARSWT